MKPFRKLPRILLICKVPPVLVSATLRSLILWRNTLYGHTSISARSNFMLSIYESLIQKYISPNHGERLSTLQLHDSFAHS